MRLGKNVKPITYLKTHAADVLASVSRSRSPVVITHNGEAKMVVQDMESYQELQDSLAMLKLAAMGQAAIRDGQVKPAAKAFADIVRRRAASKR